MQAFDVNQNKEYILLTGGTGFLGRFFIKSLLAAGYCPVVLGRRTEAYSLEERLGQYFTQVELDCMSLIEGDLTEIQPELIAQNLASMGIQPKAFYHIAGLVKFDLKLREELFRSNVFGTMQALRLAKLVNATHFYHVSTAYTAGIQANAGEMLHPISSSFNNPYEESKCLAEHLVYAFQTDELRTTILRPSIIIGDSVTGEADTQFSIYGFLRGLVTFKKKIMKEMGSYDGTLSIPFEIEADPAGLSNLVPVNYVAQVMLAALKQPCEHRIYHITNPHAPTKQDLLEIFMDLLEINGLALVDQVSSDNRWSKAFAKFINVYKPYLQNDPIFAVENTKQLLSQSRDELLQLNREDYLRIFKPALQG